MPTSAQISAGTFHGCSIDSIGGAVRCWGAGISGQLGNGTDTDSLAAVAVAGITATSVAAGGSHTCAVVADTTVRCWGSSGSGQMGNATTTSSNTAQTTTGVTGATKVGAGSSHSCALIVGGTVSCWGLNSSGQLGNGSTTNSTTAVLVSGVTNATGLAAGGDTTCALLASGGVSCWGSNDFGQLGNNTVVNAPSPVDVQDAITGISLVGATAIAVGQRTACAATSSGTKCWGSNSSGQIGDGTTIDRGRATAISGVIGTAASVSTGDGFTCITSTNGGAQCVGNNYYGQLGAGTFANSSTPLAVSGSSFAEISTGTSFALGRLADGTIRVWGIAQFGELSVGGSDLPVNISP